MARHNMQIAGLYRLKMSFVSTHLAEAFCFRADKMNRSFMRIDFHLRTSFPAGISFLDIQGRDDRITVIRSVPHSVAEQLPAFQSYT